MTTFEILADGSTVAAVAAEPNGENQLPVHGVIIGEGDITRGLSGKRTRWPGDVLETMAEDDLFVGKPITMADSLDPEQHVGVELTDDGPQLTGAVSMDEKVGEVTDVAYEEEVGLLFDGFLADWEAEETVESGLAQVSPVVVREVELVEGEEGDDDALYEPTEARAARDLALVADGAAPSNDINVGALESASDVAEALSSHFGVDVTGSLEAGSDASGGDNRGGDDGPQGSSGQSTPASDWRTYMSDDLTDKERELLAAARQKDDPTVVEAEVPERLTELEEQINEHEEVISAASDLEDPEVMDAEQAEAMAERVEIVEGLMAEALTEETGLSENAVDRMPFDAMAAHFEDDEGELDVEALTQSPESGSGPTDTGGDGPTDEDVERIEEIGQKLEVMENALPDERIEALQNEAAELAGTDDYDAALEVL